MGQLIPKEQRNCAPLSVPNNKIIANAYTQQISHPMVTRRYYRCSNHFSNYTALDHRCTTPTIAGSSYSIGLDAFVPVDAAVVTLFLTAAVEDPAACIWGDCSDFLAFDRSVSGERI